MSKQTDLINIPDAITVSGSNVGIGTSPSTGWRTAFNTTATQVGLTGSLFNLDVSTGDRRCMVSSNAILNASGDFQHILEGHATIYSQQSGTHRWYTAPSASAGATASASEKLRIDSDGLKFNGDTAAANALDDYEEGTWTPSVNAGFTVSTIDYARYTKVGDMVHVQTIFGLSGTGNTTHLEVGGLPFITRSTGYTASPVDFGKGGIKGTYVRSESATTTVKFYYPSENTTVNRLQIRGNQIGESYILFGLTYQTNS